jgi:hypothetical protein
LLVTLCIRCHIRIHHSSGLRYWFSEMLVRLWRELHPNAPMQLQLTFRNADKTETSRALLKEPVGKILPLLTLPKLAPPHSSARTRPPQCSIVGEGPQVSHDARKGESGGMIT